MGSSSVDPEEPGVVPSAGGATPARIPAGDWLRAVHDRDFGSEGIPMVLALMRLHGPQPQVASAAVRADGRHIAEQLTAVRDELFPGQRDQDMGCLVSTMQATSAALAGEATAAVSR